MAHARLEQCTRLTAAMGIFHRAAEGSLFEILIDQLAAIVTPTALEPWGAKFNPNR